MSFLYFKDLRLKFLLRTNSTIRTLHSNVTYIDQIREAHLWKRWDRRNTDQILIWKSQMELTILKSHRIRIKDNSKMDIK